MAEKSSRPKLNRAPLETGLYSVILRDKSVAERFTGKSYRKDGPRAVSDAVQKKLRRLPNYKLLEMSTNIVAYREGIGGIKTYAEIFDI